MSEAVIGAIIAAVAAAGTTVYSVEKSSSNADKARKAAAEQAAAAAAASGKQRAQEAAVIDNNLASQIKAAIAAKQGTTTPGLSPDFLGQEIEQEFPGNEDLIKRLVSQSYSGSGGG